MHPAQLLEWYLEAGVDECVGDVPVNRLRAAAPEAVAAEALPSQPTFTPVALPPVALAAPAAPVIPPLQGRVVMPPSAAIAAARAAADAATTLDALYAAIRAFDGCALKKTATNTVTHDGTAHAPVMLIGEAPGAQEDIQGIPFCGPSGKLLDKMLASIGLSRGDNTLISNTVFWRPPGNRTPSNEETAICEPFVQKHIALTAPKFLICSGGVAVNAVLKKELALSRLRGTFYDYTNPYLPAPIPAAVIFHPSYLLRSPGQKRQAWYDLQIIQAELKRRGILPA